MIQIVYVEQKHTSKQKYCVTTDFKDLPEQKRRAHRYFRIISQCVFTQECSATYVIHIFFYLRV